MRTIDINNKITIDELKKMADNMFGELVKAVVDIEKKVMIVDAELHSDQEKEFLKNGSDQNNLWGINLYPDEDSEDFIEFDSMINLRPSWGNRSRGVDNLETQNTIKNIVKILIYK